ncbi:MAG: GGDEF domain-containing protein [Acidobacteriota bacterium]
MKLLRSRRDLWATLLPTAGAVLLLALSPRLAWIAPAGQPSPALLFLLIGVGVAAAIHRPLKGESLGLGAMVIPPALYLSGGGPAAALAATCLVLADLALRLIRTSASQKHERRGLLRLLEEAGRGALATLGGAAAWAAVRFLWELPAALATAAAVYLLIWIGLDIADRKIRRPDQALRPQLLLPPFALDLLGWVLGGAVAVAGLAGGWGLAAALLGGLGLLVLESARNAWILKRADNRIHDLERLGLAGDRLLKKDEELVQLIERIRDESAKVLPFLWFHFEALAPGYELRSWWSGPEGKLEEGMPDPGNWAPVLPGFHKRAAWQILERQLRAYGRVVARVRFWCDPRRLDPKAIDLLDLLIPQASLSVQRCFAGQEAETDPLTGALLRRALEPKLNQTYYLACQHGGAMSVVLCDIDHFKKINDTWGHAVGDRALVAVSGVLKASQREGDLCCRYGGEEFLLLADGIAGEDALGMAERLRRGVEELQFEVEGQRVPLTMSAGVASFPDLYIKSAAELILFADEALYEAKRRGRNRCLLDVGQGKYLDVAGQVLTTGETAAETPAPPRIFA